MIFTVNGNRVQWDVQKGGLICNCYSDGDSDWIALEISGLKIFNLINYPHTVNGFVVNDFHEFLDAYGDGNKVIIDFDGTDRVGLDGTDRLES